MCELLPCPTGVVDALRRAGLDDAPLCCLRVDASGDRVVVVLFARTLDVSAEGSTPGVEGAGI